jgi:hypothetical protein
LLDKKETCNEEAKKNINWIWNVPYPVDVEIGGPGRARTCDKIK